MIAKYLLSFFLLITLSCSENKSSEGSDSDSTSSEGSESASKISVTGSLSLGNSDTVLAVPLSSNGSFSSSSVANIKSSTLEGDGSFNVEASKSSEYVFVAKDSNATGLGQVTGFLSISNGAASLKLTGGDDDLIRFPLSSLKEENDSFDFGQVSDNSGEANSEKNLSAISELFNLEANVLNELAKTDDVLRGIKNVIANTAADGNSSWSMKYFHFWYANAADFKNVWSEPSDFSYNGYGFYMGGSGQSSIATFDNICAPTSSANHKSIKLVPPATISRGENNFDSTTPEKSLSNELVTETETDSSGQETCGAGEFYASDEDSEDRLNFNFGGDGYTGVSPAGEWKLYIDEVQVAGFDVAASSPVREDSTPKVYIPTIKASVSNNYITKVEVKLHLYDSSTSTFSEVSDLETFKKVTGNSLNVGCTDYESSSRQEYSSDMSSSEGNIFEHTFTEQWLYTDQSGAGSDPYCSALVVDYKMAGMSIKFRINP